MFAKRIALLLFALTCVCPALAAGPVAVEPQPFQASAARLDTALEYLGSPLAPAIREQLKTLTGQTASQETAASIQALLDPLCFAYVDINPEARVKVERGPAQPELIQGGWRTFLVKVHNGGGVRAQLQCESPNAAPVLNRSSGEANPRDENRISDAQLSERFLEIAFYNGRPLEAALSGLEVEYKVLQIYTNARGKREASLQFHIGEGTRDLGHRSTLSVLFDVKPSVRLTFEVLDDDGSPTMASFTIRDNIERLADIADAWKRPDDYRLAKSLSEHWTRPGIPANPPLTGVYPLPSRRVADRDEYPDFFFQPQVYRQSGESLMLAPGKYDVTWNRGPEYLPQTRTITVGDGPEQKETFQLKRWINIAKEGWYSADHHVHAGGCSHYEAPEAGVKPEAMLRQAQGEDLDVSCVLTWGPCWYHQKTFFEGKVSTLSTPSNLIRYDVEVSGFPSSHAGHVCLLRLKEDDYPGTTRIEEWPSWTQPVLQWAKSQGGVVGYAHSGWGLEPVEATPDLPNYVMPKMDGIGANEYIVTVANGACDFISAGDTPLTWEMNIWYHTLNCGYRTSISGESDYPCIFDERVGMIRSYAPLDKGLDFDQYIERIRQGRTYVSDGRSHILDFKAGDATLASDSHETRLDKAGPVHVTARVAAYLPEQQDDAGKMVAEGGNVGRPYWHIEKARIGTSRKVPVELVVNGLPVARQEIDADGTWKEIAFDHEFDRSSWVALRVMYSSHTNPLYVLLDGQPVYPSRASAQWCRAAVDKCWDMKMPAIRRGEQEAAKQAYDAARAAYDKIIAEAKSDAAPVNQLAAKPLPAVAAPEGAVLFAADGQHAMHTAAWEEISATPDSTDGALFTVHSGKGEEHFRWLLDGLWRGRYEVFVWIPAGQPGNRSTKAHYLVYSGATLEEELVIDQTQNKGAWRSLGTWWIRPGSYIELTNEGCVPVVAGAVAVLKR